MVAVKDGVGIRAVDDYTFEVKLTDPQIISYHLCLSIHLCLLNSHLLKQLAEKKEFGQQYLNWLFPMVLSFLQSIQSVKD